MDRTKPIIYVWNLNSRNFIFIYLTIKMVDIKEMAYAIHITFWRYKADSMKTYTFYSDCFIEVVVISFIKVFITFSKLHVSIKWMKCTKLILTKSFTKTYMLPIKTELILIIKSAPQFESIQGHFHALVSATKLLQWSTYNAYLSDEIDEWSCRKRWKLRFFLNY